MTGIIPVDPRRREAGFTLVELIVYVSLSVLVVSLAGGFLLNAAQAQRNVTVATEGANTAQLIVESIKHDVRNATELAVSGNLLVVRTAGMDDTLALTCRAWYFDSDTFYTVTTGNARVSAPSPAALDAWSVEGQGLSPINAAESSVVFAREGATVELSFSVDAGTSTVVQTAVTPRAPLEMEGTCFAG